MIYLIFLCEKNGFCLKRYSPLNGRLLGFSNFSTILLSFQILFYFLFSFPSSLRKREVLPGGIRLPVEVYPVRNLF